MQIRRCMKCMHELRAEETVCPNCGRVYGQANTESYALRPGTILDGKYLVGEMLGQGGFGITYIGFDLLLEQRVAIKEYYPMATGMVSRENGTTVVWSNTMLAKTGTERGFDNFLKEARKMAKLDSIPNVVGVKSVFIENGTAYIVMDYVEGETLLKKLQREGCMDFPTAVSLLTPVMKALDQVHAHGIVHRDISPDNIMVKKDGTLVLLDLGAAKDMEVTNSDGHISTQMVVKHGFSPAEQYTQNAAITAAMDVYAMAATVYYCCTKCIPPAAMERYMNDTLQCQPRLKPAEFQVLAKGMALRSQDRIQTIGKLISALGGIPDYDEEERRRREEERRREQEARRREEEARRREEERRRQEEERLREEQRRKEYELRRAEEAKARRERALAREAAREAAVKKAKKIAKLAAIPTAAAVVVYLVGWQIIPFSKYKNAIAAMNNKDYYAAYEQFSALGSYRDSGDEAKLSLYSYACSLMYAKQYDEAIPHFEQLKNFSDSSKKLEFCKNSILYSQAEALFAAGKYAEAREAFAQLASFEDSEDKAKESGYQYALELEAAENWEEAYKVFDKLSQYKDSRPKYQNARYRYAQQLEETGKWEQASNEYGILGNYEDSDNRRLYARYQYAQQLENAENLVEAYTEYKHLGVYKDSTEKYQALRYQYALKLETAERWVDASHEFNALSKYKDSASRYQNARYQYALELEAAGKWTQATGEFESLGNYKDCAKRIQNTRYQNALDLLNQKKYTAAVEEFTKLNTYQDSKKQVDAAMWAYINDHKNSTDLTTYQYLTALQKKNDQDAKKLYKSFYSYSVSLVAVNTSEDDDTTISTYISKWSSYTQFTFKLSGGPPAAANETVTLYAKSFWPNGSSRRANWYWEDKSDGSKFGIEWNEGLYYDPSRGKTGKLTVKVYIKGTNECIGEGSVYLN